MNRTDKKQLKQLQRKLRKHKIQNVYDIRLRKIIGTNKYRWAVHGLYNLSKWPIKARIIGNDTPQPLNVALDEIDTIIFEDYQKKLDNPVQITRSIMLSHVKQVTRPEKA